MKKQIKKDKEFYMKLKYPITIIECEEGGYFAEIKDLPGCMTQGETIEEIFKNIEEAKELWIETALELGIKVPLPTEVDVDSKIETEYFAKVKKKSKILEFKKKIYQVFLPITHIKGYQAIAA